jgi:formylglycine-generating enzyme required for sulfatase activity
VSQADLEILISARSGASYGVTLRFRRPEVGQDKAFSASWTLDEAALRQRGHDPVAYGEEMAAQLLAGSGTRSFLDQALAVAASLQTPMRLRLFIGPDASTLHSLRWETLRLPGAAAPLAVGEWVRFTRYLDSDNWGAVVVRPRSDLRGLIVVASPDVAGARLAEVRTTQELDAARAGLAGIPATELARRGEVTLPNLLAHLRGGCDILYMVAHGAIVDGEPQILLERPDGGRAWTSGRKMAVQMGELAQPPSLAVLVSCQSAGVGGQRLAQDDGALAGLGPRLAAAGVPAVVAMQGNVSMETIAAFMPVLLAELRRDGQVDRAMAVARGAVRERPDWWMPVLFTRLSDGRVWLPGSPDSLPEIPRQNYEPETVYIPAGTFRMGADDPAALPPERPAHDVLLSAFRIGKYPITVRQYAAFIKARKEYPAPSGWFNREPPAGRLEQPVTEVSWQDAIAYCAWLSQQTGRCYTLPSEAEWEKACSNDFSRSVPQGTTKVVTTNKYPWGDEWSDGRCNAAGSDTTPVTAHPAGASAYGVEDLLGNVQEWTRSLWGSQLRKPDFVYPYDPADGREVTDPVQLPAQVRLVHRGGSFESQPADLRVSARNNALPDSKLAWRSFRVVMILEEIK